MALTATEKKKFKADQLAQLQRMNSTRLDALLDPPDVEADQKVAVRVRAVDKLANLKEPEMRCRVNIESVRWGFNRDTGKRFEIVYSGDSDYTVQEKTKAEQGLMPGDQWCYVIPHLVK